MPEVAPVLIVCAEEARVEAELAGRGVVVSVVSWEFAAVGSCAGAGLAVRGGGAVTAAAAGAMS